MAEITRERQGEIVREVLAVLRLHPEGLQARKVISEVETRLGLTDFEKSDYPSTPGVRRFDKILRFNTIPAVKAGWLLKSKGVWTITVEGEEALQKFTDPAEFIRESVRRYRAWKKAQPEDDDTDDVEAEERRRS